MDFDDLDEVAPVAENTQPPTGTLLAWAPRTHRIPGLCNSMQRFSDKVLRELDPAVRSSVTERSSVRRAPTAKLRLLCIHGVADTYEQSWFELEAESPPEIEVVVHEFPGHGRRDDETVCTSINDLTEDAFEAMRDVMETGSFALLGHSIGCLVVLELVKRAQEELNVKPVAVYMVERGAPQHPLWTEKGYAGLQNEEFSLEVDSKSVADSGLELKDVDLDVTGGKEVVLMINSVSPGLLESWAASNEGRSVKPKDEIARVNGVSGNAANLRSALEAAAIGGGTVKLGLLRRPFEFLYLHMPITQHVCKAANRTFLRWQRSWMCENDTREVGYFMFTCPLVALSAEACVIPPVNVKDMDPYVEAVVDAGCKHFAKVEAGKVFMGHFPRETFDDWKDWTEHADGFKYVECPGCDHMGVKDSRTFKRTVFDSLMDQVKLW